MRILQVNKFLYRRAGAEAYMLDLADLLVERGHEVGIWGTKEKLKIKNEKLKIFEDVLIEPIDYSLDEGLGSDLKKFGHMVWSLEAVKKFEAVLKKFQPDVVHLHNIYHHISPSILTVARRHKIPIVQTLHDFKWICPNYKLFTDHAVCQRCKKYRYWNAIIHKCLQNSYIASSAAAAEMCIHRAMQIYEKSAAQFIAPSSFLRELVIGWGKDGDKILHVPHFVPSMSSRALQNAGRGDLEQLKNGIASSPAAPRKDRLENYILFAGRLAEEKGIWLLLEIAKALPEIKFKVAGEGPEFESVKLKVKSEKLSNVEMLGFQEKDELQKLILQARLIIVPSIWYENYPMSILEAQAQGKPVLASASGGIPEMIEDGRTGFLVKSATRPLSKNSGRVADWIDKIKKIYYDEALIERVGKAARERVLKENDPEKHYQKLMEIYQKCKIQNAK